MVQTEQLHPDQVQEGVRRLINSLRQQVRFEDCRDSWRQFEEFDLERFRYQPNVLAAIDEGLVQKGQLEALRDAALDRILEIRSLAGGHCGNSGKEEAKMVGLTLSVHQALKRRLELDQTTHAAQTLAGETIGSGGGRSC
jgi:hypothetical protein